MAFKDGETCVIHNIVDPRPVQRTGPDCPLTLVDKLNCFAKWVIINNGDCERYTIQNATTNGYADCKGKQAVFESPDCFTRWQIKVVSRCMYRIYDPTSQLFWTSHPDSNEIFLEPFSAGSDQWWAISSEDCK